MENNNRQGCRWDWEEVFDNAQTMHLQEFKSHYESIEPCATSSENDELWDELADYIDDFTLDDNMSMGELKSNLKQAYSITRKSGDRDCEELKETIDKLFKEIARLERENAKLRGA